jgi:cell division protein FtsZ
MMFTLVEENEDLASIKVIGIGGAGGNAVNRMIEAGLNGVDFFAVNTDMQALRESRAQTLQIGCQLTRGLGSGGDPRIGRKAIEEDQQVVIDLLDGSDMVFLTAGMGGGTGTGAAPVIARLARELGVLTVGIVTKPFLFEGSVRHRQAEEGLTALKEAVDTLIVIPNQRLLEVVPPSTSFQEAFRIADNILYEATRGIYEIIARPNHVNLDFADVRTVMKGMGVALMGTGRAEGEDRAVAAARSAISSPLLEDVNIQGARGVLVNILGAEIGIAEISEAMSLIQDAAGNQAHIIFGYGLDDSLGDTLQVTVIATGFRVDGQAQPAVVSREVPSRQRPDAPGSAAQSEPQTETAREVQPPLRQAAAMAGGAAVAHQQGASTASRFLRPLADTSAAPQTGMAPPPNVAPQTGMRQETAADTSPQTRGFRSDAFLEDLSVPAYTRKYMD